MNERINELLKEFEEKILEITGDNLEVITGHNVAATLQNLDNFAPENAEMLAETLIVKITFSTPGYDNWMFFLPPDFGALLATSMVGEEPAPFDPAEHLEPLEELMAQVLSPYLSELSSIENSQVETSALSVGPPAAMPQIGEGHILAQMKFTIDEDSTFTVYKILPNSLVEILDTESVDPQPDMEATDGNEEEYVDVSSAEFQPLRESNGHGNGNGSNLDMLMSLDMPITIEMGRTKLTIRNILELGQGSIIELDKLSGDPVDVFINNRKFAEGEVVVVDENFGVRITEIISPVEKIKSLQ